MRPYVKIILAVFLGLLLLGVAIGVYVWNKPHRNPAKEKGLAISAIALYQAYEQNEMEANALYLDKTLAIEGVLTKISQNQQGAYALEMQAGEDAMGVILVELQPSEQAKVAKLSIGQRVTVKGICTGFTMDVVIAKAVLMD